MIIKYNDKIYASFLEECYFDKDIIEINELLNDMDCNGDIQSFTVTHYMVDNIIIGDEDDNGTALENLIDLSKRSYRVPIEVIK